MTQPLYHRITLLLLLLFIGLCGLYAYATPHFEAPDEGSHYMYIHNLLESGELPVMEDRETMFLSRSVQRHHPPLYYLIGAALVSFTNRDNLDEYNYQNPLAAYGVVAPNNLNLMLHLLHTEGDTGLAIGILRAYSIVLATGTAWLIYRTAFLAFGRHSTGWFAIALLCSMPSFLFISASINNDNLVTFFYAAGVCWMVWTWQKKTLMRRDAIILGLILAGVALSKINGLGLVAFIYGWLILGIIFKRFAIKQVLQTVVISGGLLALLAGWWYIRNIQLYGEPLALAVTRSIWGRATPDNWAAIVSEAKGVWDSFWMVLGHFSIRGSDWLYAYATLFTGIGFFGVLFSLIPPFASKPPLIPPYMATPPLVPPFASRPPLVPPNTGGDSAPLPLQGEGQGVGSTIPQKRQGVIFILLSAVVLVIASLIAATTTVNVSQGRILFPALVGFAPLMAWGWQMNLEKLSNRSRFSLKNTVFFLPLLPLLGYALSVPFTILPQSYPPPLPVTQIPSEPYPVNARVDDLELLSYQVAQDTMTPDEWFWLHLYVRGTHPANPLLYVKVIDPISLVPVGSVDMYPGMTFTSDFDPTQIYRLDIRLNIDRTRLTGTQPRRLDLTVGWRIPGSDVVNDAGEFLAWQTADGQITDFLTLPGLTLIDPNYQLPAAPIPTDIVFGNAIQLAGYGLDKTQVQAGDTLQLSLYWRSLGTLPDNWITAVGLLDAENQVLTQADGSVIGYPTSAWRIGGDILDTRTLKIPADAPPGEYRLFVGWYRPEDAAMRLPAIGKHIDNHLYIPDVTITIVPSR